MSDLVFSQACDREVAIPTKVNTGGSVYEDVEGELRQIWDQLQAIWLETKQKRQSKHTHRSYAYAVTEWLNFLASLRHSDGRRVQPWEATAEHVRLWHHYLVEERRLAPASVNQRLAACSSFYSFVIQIPREQPRTHLESIHLPECLVSRKGGAMSVIREAIGGLLTNPFSSEHVERAQIRQYHQVRVLTSTETAKLLDYLAAHRHTLTGARNWALLLTFLLTGYRTHEVVSMQWGNIRPNRQQPGAWVYRWEGKGKQHHGVAQEARHAAVLLVAEHDPGARLAGVDRRVVVEVIAEGESEAAERARREVERLHPGDGRRKGHG